MAAERWVSGAAESEREGRASPGSRRLHADDCGLLLSIPQWYAELRKKSLAVPEQTSCDSTPTSIPRIVESTRVSVPYHRSCSTTLMRVAYQLQRPPLGRLGSQAVLTQDAALLVPFLGFQQDRERRHGASPRLATRVPLCQHSPCFAPCLRCLHAHTCAGDGSARRPSVRARGRRVSAGPCNTCAQELSSYYTPSSHSGDGVGRSGSAGGMHVRVIPYG